jgi:hypothetical protein
MDQREAGISIEVLGPAEESHYSMDCGPDWERGQIWRDIDRFEFAPVGQVKAMLIHTIRDSGPCADPVYDRSSDGQDQDLWRQGSPAHRHEKVPPD